MITLNARNLIGDTLYLVKPIQMFLSTCREEVRIIASPGLPFGILNRQFPGKVWEGGVPFGHLANTTDTEINLSASKAADICFAPGDHGKPVHISEGYAALLGVYTKGMNTEPPTNWRKVKEPTRDYVVIAPFSASCSRHTGEKPNKTLDNGKWEYLLRYLRDHDYRVKCVGAPGEFLEGTTLPISSHVSAHGIWEMEELLQNARMVVSVDNGIAHLAAAMHVPLVVLWPKASSRDFIAPVHFDTTELFYIDDPNKASPGQLLWGLRQIVSKIEERHYTDAVLSSKK